MAGNVLLQTEHAGIYERIQAFRFDEGNPTFPFVSRLARENGWTHSYAARTISEYRRFVALALVAGHPVSPSDPVDQVWHLHLQYTESYWKRFCGEILGSPLHHEPTRGGKTEKDKFTSWYAATLRSYRQYFGEDAPRDIWPDGHTRFANIHFERVNRNMNFVVSKKWTAAAACLVLAGTLLSWLL